MEQLKNFLFELDDVIIGEVIARQIKKGKKHHMLLMLKLFLVQMTKSMNTKKKAMFLASCTITRMWWFSYSRINCNYVYK